MRSARSHFLLPALGLLAALLLPVVGYIGFGWAVWSRQPWACWILGYPRFERVSDAYQYATENFFSGDSNGDGHTDGLDLWEGGNPKDPPGQPLVIEWDTDGFRAWGTFGIDSEPLGGGTAAHKFLFPCAGARLPVRGRVLSRDYLPHRTPVGFALRLTPPDFARLALPGATLSSSSLVVPVKSDGSFEFDVAVTDGVHDAAEDSPMLTFDNARTGARIKAVKVIPVWRQPPIAVVMEDGEVSSPGRRESQRFYYLREWPLLPACDAWLFEAARDEEGANWYTVRFVLGTRPGGRSLPVCQMAHDPVCRYYGLLKFRIVPVFFHPPEAVSAP